MLRDVFTKPTLNTKFEVHCCLPLVRNKAPVPSSCLTYQVWAFLHITWLVNTMPKNEDVTDFRQIQRLNLDCLNHCLKL